MKSKIITKEGYEKLSTEFNYLWRQVRPEITKMVAWAASLGDRSDNADYQTNKQKLREIDGRIRFIEKTLSDIRVVEYDTQQDGGIFFGAWVELEGEGGKTIKVRIVGPEEIYDRNDYISIDSPMARACISKSVNDEIEVHAPHSKQYWSVTSIKYS
jgi:transcription elongation factor GreB